MTAQRKLAPRRPAHRAERSGASLAPRATAVSRAQPASRTPVQISNADKDVGEAGAPPATVHCLCRLTHEERREIGHFLGLLADVGEGSLPRGLEHLRDALKSHLSLKRRMDKAVMVVTSIVVGSLTSAALAALWIGLKHYLADKAGP